MTGHLPRRRESVVLREVAGETFLVPIHGHIADLQELFVLNEVGRYLWDRLDGERSVENLVSEVFATFDISEEQAEHDTAVFLEELSAAGLVAEHYRVVV